MNETNTQPSPIIFKDANYAWLRRMSYSNGWSVQSAVSRITQKLQQYKLGKLTDSEFLAFINQL